MNQLAEIELELFKAFKELEAEDNEKRKRIVERRREQEYRRDLRRGMGLVE